MGESSASSLGSVGDVQDPMVPAIRKVTVAVTPAVYCRDFLHFSLSKTFNILSRGKALHDQSNRPIILTLFQLVAHDPSPASNMLLDVTNMLLVVNVLFYGEYSSR
jgi:hypothetical protein